jgi:hypothetical protein
MRLSNKISAFILLLTAVFSFSQETSFGQDTSSSFPWTANQVIQPAQLSAMIEAGSTKNMLILNAGPMDDIKGAVNIGPVSEKKNARKLTQYLKNVPKDKAIVVYCGCCPMNVCPNIRPAFKILNKEGFTNFKIMYLEHNLNVDWVTKGYPMANN